MRAILDFVELEQSTELIIKLRGRNKGTEMIPLTWLIQMEVMAKIESLTLPLIIIFKLKSQLANPVLTKSKNLKKIRPV